MVVLEEGEEEKEEVGLGGWVGGGGIGGERREETGDSQVPITLRRIV